MILVDDREPVDIVNSLRNFGVEVQVQRLTAADYIVGNFAVERKTVEDFHFSIVDGRLWRQLKGMLDQFPTSNILLVISGRIPPRTVWRRLDGRPNKIFLSRDERDRYLKTIISAVTTIWVSFNRVHLFNVSSKNQFVDLLGDLYYRQTSRTPAKPVPKGKVSCDLKEAKWRMLTMIPSIGSRYAKLLSERYSIKELSLLSEEELKGSIKGLGSKRASIIRQVLNT